MALFYANPLATLAVGAAVTAVLLGLYFLLFARALAPKRGTLEWIGLYDRPGLLLSGSLHPFRARHLLPLLGAAVLGGVLYCLAICLQLRSFSLFGSAQGRLMLALGAGLSALTASGGFVLMLGLTGSALLSFFGAVLLALELGSDYPTAACLVWALGFFHRWAATDFEKPARASFLPLALTAAMLAVGVSLSTDLSPAAVTLMIGTVAVAIFRLRHTHRMDRFRGFAGSLALFFLTFWLLVTATQAILVWQRGDYALLAQPRFYLNTLYAWLLPRGFAFTVPLLSPAVDLPLILFGLTATVFSLYDARRYGRPQGLILLLGAVGGLLTVLFSGVYVHGVAVIPAIVCSLARAKERDAKALALTGCIGAFLCSLLHALLLTGVF